MKILKGRAFLGYLELIQFIDDNKIIKEDIFAITQGDMTNYSLFYYANPDFKEKDRNIWGKLNY